MNEKTLNVYDARFNRVYDYISQHLDEKLTLEILSEVAHFSRFHFHRQFSEYTGMTLSRYIQLLRLKRASYRLAFERDERITDIALDAQFENPESFSRAFKNIFRQTPSQFRSEPDWSTWHKQVRINKPEFTRKLKMEVKIVDFDTTQVAVLEHRKSPERIDDTVNQFIEWRKQSQLSPVASSQTYGIVYDNPDTTEPDQFRFDLCGSVDSDVPENPQQVKNGEIPGGRCAVLRHNGNIKKIAEKVYYLYGNWLPESGEELRDYPCFFHYLTLPSQVPEDEHVTDIYLPLK